MTSSGWRLIVIGLLLFVGCSKEQPDDPPHPPESEPLQVIVVSSAVSEEVPGRVEAAFSGKTISAQVVLPACHSGEWRGAASGEGELVRVYMGQECEEEYPPDSALVRIDMTPDSTAGYRALTVYRFNPARHGFEMVGSAEFR